LLLIFFSGRIANCPFYGVAIYPPAVGIGKAGGEFFACEKEGLTVFSDFASDFRFFAFCQIKKPPSNGAVI
jgi:hypothetical protein